MEDRLPWQPLEDAIRARYELDSRNQVCLMLGINSNSRVRIVRDGLRWEQADRYCVQFLGEHPLVIWGLAWVAREDVDESEEQAA